MTQEAAADRPGFDPVVDQTPALRLVSLEVENFMRVKLARIEPYGSVVKITGDNEQGKSSLINALVSAIGGAKWTPKEPVRRGEEFARVVLDLEKIRIEKWVYPSGKVTLAVTDQNGYQVGSPQKLLDSLYDAIAVDPEAFSRMKEAEQAETLMRLAGLDFSEVDRERKELYDLRTQANRDVKRLETLAASAPQFPPDTPDAEVSISALTEQYGLACEEQARNDELRRHCEALEKDLANTEGEVSRLRKELEAAQERARLVRNDLALAREAAGSLEDPDVAGMLARLRTAEQLNRNVRAKREYTKMSREYEEKQRESKALTLRIEEIDAGKAKALAEAKYPVKGLRVDPDGVVRLDGERFAQASSARKIKVGLAVGAAMAPQLRLAVVRNGSLLDRHAMSQVHDWAEKRGYTVVVEQVATDQPVGFVIEDGEVVSSPESRGELKGELKGKVRP